MPGFRHSCVRARLPRSGGKRADCGKGCPFEPTVLAGCARDMDIMRQERFGPVLPLATFTDLDAAITMANDCE
ncbi:aldehyde dehydrogenase family protein [Solidesulfovibrio alcoholivorans]|uniref:aldehyde dehydrogenase family protein n=1 Tax=Solidesulfovibrio alcoholivorans TaxID=81406 RepID=UPI001FE02B6F|nr:aldehyde dehydrogenase family protein [Solidesulfovibrio alcoholivorans]